MMIMKAGTCIMCFSVNINLFDIKGSRLQAVYEELTDVKIQSDGHRLCHLCLQRLRQCSLLVRTCRPRDKNQLERTPLTHLSTRPVQTACVDEHLDPVHNAAIKQEVCTDENEERKPEDFEYEVKLEPSTSEAGAGRNTPPGDTSGGDERARADANDKSERRQVLAMCHYDDETKPYAYDICHKRFTERSSVTVHRRIHTGEKPYHSRVCDNMMMTHTGDKPHACDTCEKKFTKMSALRSHRLTHSGAKPFSCGVCNKTFTSSGALKVHERIHTGEKPYTCDVCDRRFSKRSTLRTHRMSHNDEQPYTCDVCDKKFIKVGSLNAHKLEHAGKPYAIWEPSSGSVRCGRRVCCICR